jgi:DNA-binding transcriptional LysR family regulator
MAEARIKESKETPSGPLKVTTTVAFGSTWLTPRIREFLDTYPDIELSLILSEGELDLGMREADVAIRMSPPRQSDLVQRQLMTLRYHVFASPEYLEANGTPQTAADLAKHKLIIYGEDVRPPVQNVNWLVKEAEKYSDTVQPVLRLNNMYGIYRATQTGLGLAALPNYMVYPHSNLVQVLPELEGPGLDAYFVYPEELRHSKRIAVFRDFLIEKINEAKMRGQ